MGGINSEADGAVSGLPGDGKASACSANPLILRRVTVVRADLSPHLRVSHTSASGIS